jgi:hypothetical protein
VRALATFEPLPIKDIQRAIGQEALNRLFNECFLIHPDEPKAGAEAVKAMLYQRYGARLKECKSRD